MILKSAEGREADLEKLRRLRASATQADQAKIDREIRIIEKGAAGERSAAHFIDREFGSSPRMAILHDLRLQMGEDVAQIDHLVIHRFQQAAWVLETKNFTGRLSCDEHGDWTLWNGRTPISIPSPINQARRQVILLKAWLSANAISTIRTIEPVVLISPKSSINRKHLSPDDHVVKSDNFGQWWNKRTDEKLGVVAAFGMLGRHLIDGMSEEDLRALGAKLCEAHTPLARVWERSLRLSGSLAKSEEAPDFPRVIESKLGSVTITRLADGRLALRNDPGDELIAAVKASCKGRARWSPRFRNWVFDQSALPQIVSSLEKLLPV
jgi:hypothetical protein